MLLANVQRNNSEHIPPLDQVVMWQIAGKKLKCKQLHTQTLNELNERVLKFGAKQVNLVLYFLRLAAFFVTRSYPVW